MNGALGAWALPGKHWSVSMISNAEEILQKGSEILGPLFATHGFSFQIIGKGNSSGGSFSYGAFRKSERWLEFHFRYSLGMLSYHLADCSMTHQNFMRSVIGKPNLSHYPGFSKVPLDGFRQLLLDLQEYGADFLSGTDECLQSRIEASNSLPPIETGLPD